MKRQNQAPRCRNCDKRIWQSSGGWWLGVVSLGLNFWCDPTRERLHEPQQVQP